jgi:hypothetical protein
VQGHEFQSDLKILELHNFDMIIGMEWLERYSPMHIHWAQKWISIPYQGKHITIQGNGSYMTECHMVELVQMTADLEGSNSAELPKEIQTLLQQFQAAFETPSKLPPRRVCDHMIQLIQGATLGQAISLCSCS